MKKILFGIFSIILGFLGFGFGDELTGYVDLCGTYCFIGDGLCNGDGGRIYFNGVNGGIIVKTYYDTMAFSVFSEVQEINQRYSDMSVSLCNKTYSCVSYFDTSCDGVVGGGSSTPSDITVYYNNGQSSTGITCDGVQAIQINGLSTITSTNTFTPYYNISYTDEDNQKLTESYSKDILYLENGQFKKTYTGNNDRILTVQGSNSENSFSGYLPTFDITGGINDVVESGNIFNNFAENSVKFTLSNIPSYIQYVILLFILFFILGFIRKFRRK